MSNALPENPSISKQKSSNAPTAIIVASLALAGTAVLANIIGNDRAAAKEKQARISVSRPEYQRLVIRAALPQDKGGTGVAAECVTKAIAGWSRGDSASHDQELQGPVLKIPGEEEARWESYSYYCTIVQDGKKDYAAIELRGQSSRFRGDSLTIREDFLPIRKTAHAFFDDDTAASFDAGTLKAYDAILSDAYASFAAARKAGQEKTNGIVQRLQKAATDSDGQNGPVQKCFDQAQSRLINDLSAVQANQDLKNTTPIISVYCLLMNDQRKAETKVTFSTYVEGQQFQLSLTMDPEKNDVKTTLLAPEEMPFSLDNVTIGAYKNLMAREWKKFSQQTSPKLQ